GHRIDDALKDHNRAVAHQLDDAAAVLRNKGIGDLGAHRFQTCDRARLVDLHQVRIAHDISCEDRQKPSLHTGRHHVLTPNRVEPLSSGRKWFVQTAYGSRRNAARSASSSSPAFAISHPARSRPSRPLMKFFSCYHAYLCQLWPEPSICAAE